ncbi:MAG TPA: type I methionyl aminopeptidase [bacterium]|nr:type I methionyl aminopeptidase [Dictyoglomota bacterium]HHV80998.1 type I methionyl aminopeptidase [bacterium]HOK29545.1 type I methionyl aminopeptidase [bacterium]HOL54862.1 type I methionyl aminopeptidase [bacterium]HOP55583.1 type I methionyl aminopeptidase [bacterium]
MIRRKTQREIDVMFLAGQIVAKVLKVLQEMVVPGISTFDLDQKAEELIRNLGARPAFKGYNGFPGSICISINEEVIHGIPKKSVKIKEGDIVKIDIGAEYNGYYADSATTIPVGKVSPEVENLLEVGRKALEIGISNAKPGNHLSDISHSIESFVLAHNMSVVKSFVGHGIGRELHEEPQVPNYGPPGTGPILEPGIALAIEPMVNLGKEDVVILKDGWTVITRDKKPSCHFEHTVIVQDGEPLITTRLK